MNILLCFDDNDGNYTRHAAVTILSLLETNKNNKIKIWIISSLLPQENIHELKRIVKLYNQEIEFIIDNNIVSEELKKVIINKNKLTRGAWYRYFFQKYITGIERILYLDCDTLVMKDISEIYNMDMHGKAIAGWYVCFPPRCKNKLYGIKNYFNSGVLLFDVKKFSYKKINITNMDRINKKYSKYFTGSDEEKINIIYKNDIYIYEQGMNYQLVNKRFNKNIKNAAIIHCLQKPYKEKCIIPQKYIDLYYFYLQKTKWKNFPKEKLKATFLGYKIFYIYTFIFNFLIYLLGDKYMGKIIYLKQKFFGI